MYGCAVVAVVSMIATTVVTTPPSVTQPAHGVGALAQEVRETRAGGGILTECHDGARDDLVPVSGAGVVGGEPRAHANFSAHGVSESGQHDHACFALGCYASCSGTASHADVHSDRVG